MFRRGLREPNFPGFVRERGLASGADGARLGRSGRFDRREAGLGVLRGYALNDEPQPQEPVTFGFMNLNPEPWSPST